MLAKTTQIGVICGFSSKFPDFFAFFLPEFPGIFPFSPYPCRLKPIFPRIYHKLRPGVSHICNFSTGGKISAKRIPRHTFAAEFRFPQLNIISPRAISQICLFPSPQERHSVRFPGVPHDPLPKRIPHCGFPAGPGAFPINQR